MEPPADLRADVIRRLSAISGPVITERDPEYDAARRVWNGMTDRRPLAVVRAAGPDDVAAAIQVASEMEVSLAVRGGGHNVAGNGTVDGGVVLDLGGLRAIDVDASSGTARVGPGATLADLDAATQAHALAVPVGVVSGTPAWRA